MHTYKKFLVNAKEITAQTVDIVHIISFVVHYYREHYYHTVPAHKI